MGGTQHRHLARLPGRGADHEGVARRVRLPDLLPFDRGADDRRRRRLARVDRRRRLAAQRPAVGGRRAGAGVLRPRQRQADEHRREPRARPARRRARSAARCSSTAAARSGRSRAASASRSASTPSEAAIAVIQVANANMADAVRLISIRRGYDPREFALVVFGGAGPLHGVALARELSIPTVLVPPSPGITSALGCLLVDVRHDLSTMFLAPPRDRRRGRDRGRVRAARGRGTRAARGRGRPGRADVAAAPRSTCATSASGARCRSRRRAPVDLDEAVARFHDEHEREYDYRRDGAPVEIYRLNVRAVGVTPKPSSRHEPTDEHAGAGSRDPCHFDCRGGRRHARATAAQTCRRARARRPGDRRPARLDDASCRRAGGPKSTSG